MARVVVAGDVPRVWFSAGSSAQMLPPGDLPPGTYDVHAVFGDAPSVVGQITLIEGATRTLRCSGSLRMCR